LTLKTVHHGIDANARKVLDVVVWRGFVEEEDRD